MKDHFEKYLLDSTKAKSCIKTEVIQSLWSGYGEISRYELHDCQIESVVIKHIDLSKVGVHPGGWNTNKSHQRKVKSYQVETIWYEQWSHKCQKECKVPQFLGTYQSGEEQWIILEDLNAHYPTRRSRIQLNEVKVCLRWLANFHALFLEKKPEGLWKKGTYWHLDTRPDEFEKMELQALKAKAHLIDQKLNNGQYKTIVHGDAKLANFCFSEDGQEVAAVDFQYVGGGCGMQDVAYFLGSCLSSEACEKHEEELLSCYFTELQRSIEDRCDFHALEAEWRKMYPIAWADFTRFLFGWKPTHKKLNSYCLRLMEEVLAEI